MILVLVGHYSSLHHLLFFFVYGFYGPWWEYLLAKQYNGMGKWGMFHDPSDV